MSLLSFWSDACKHASSKSQATLVDTTYASNGILIAAYVVSALASCSTLFLWKCKPAEHRRRAWQMYGQYCGLMLCASCFGALSWAAHMMFYATRWKWAFSTSLPLEEDIHFSVVDSHWTAVHYVTLPLEMLCSSLAKLFVLHRLAEFAVPREDSMRKRWVLGGRVVTAFVVLGCAIMLGANIAQAAHYQQSAKAYRTALSYRAAGNTEKYDEFNAEANQQDALVYQAYPVSQFSEVSVLLFIVVAFLLAGFLSARRLSFALRAIVELSKRPHSPSSVLADAAAHARTLRMKIVCTTLLVFVAFLLQFVTATMTGFAFALRDYPKSCPGVTDTPPCDTSCYDVYTFITVWLGSTPEFKPIIVLLSSPLTLLAVLAGMTTGLTTESIQQNSQPKQTDDVPLHTIERD